MMKKAVAFITVIFPIFSYSKALPGASYCQDSYIYKTSIVQMAINPTKNHLESALSNGGFLGLSGKEVQQDIENERSSTEAIGIYRILGTPKGGEYMNAEMDKCQSDPKNNVINYQKLKKNGLISDD